MIMMNLFELFDPCTSNSFSFNWLILLFSIILFPYNYWFIPSRLMVFWLELLGFLYDEFKVIMNKSYQSNILVFVSLMLYLFLFNFMGLFPYVFTSTSHMVFNMFISMSLWLGMMFYGFLYIPYSMLIHMLPSNTPEFLMNFMVLIELISNLIRPWTLAIRLTANLVAGHLLLTLLGLLMSKLWLPLVLLFVVVQNLLVVLEASMAFIQSYVFSILSVLYFSEFKS